jgi:hypothetical protein
VEDTLAKDDLEKRKISVFSGNLTKIFQSLNMWIIKNEGKKSVHNVGIKFSADAQNLRNKTRMKMNITLR